MSVLKKLWGDPVGSKVFAAIIVGALGVVAATVKGWWPAIGSAVLDAWHWLGQVSSTPNWLLVILWLSLAVCFLRAGVIAVGLMRGAKNNDADWRTYTRDNFLDVNWQWRYGGSGDIYGITPICPSCGCQLTVNSTDDFGRDQTRLHCIYCKQVKATIDGYGSAVEQKVHLLIQRNLRTGEWRGRNQHGQP